jgi:hypothetical protein
MVFGVVAQNRMDRDRLVMTATSEEEASSILTRAVA